MPDYAMVNDLQDVPAGDTKFTGSLSSHPTFHSQPHQMVSEQRNRV